jgi:hypothetical protein
MLQERNVSYIHSSSHTACPNAKRIAAVIPYGQNSYRTGT